MYKVAVCDDEIKTCREMEKYVERFGEESQEMFQTESFYYGQEFLQRMEDTSFDLVFLDIELADTNGVEIGKRIRNICSNQKVQIVYISSRTQYAMELFQMRPLDFLVKPFSYEQVHKVLSVFLELNRESKGIFEYQAGQNFYRLPYDEILYLTSEGRQIKIVTEQRKAFPAFYGKLAGTLKNLGTGFLMIHKSYIVNLQYIRQYNYEYIVMANGETLSISRPHRKEVRDKMMQLWRKQSGHE